MTSRARHRLRFYFPIPALLFLCSVAAAAVQNTSDDPNRDIVSGVHRDADAKAADDTLAPAFTSIPELTSGFQLLYTQQFSEAREKFTIWESEHPDQPFGQVAVAAS